MVNWKENFKNLIKQLIFRYGDNDVSALSAQVTYYLILSFFPFVIFLINILSFTPISTGEITQNIAEFLPKNSGKLVLNIINETVEARSSTLLSIGMLATIWSSSNGISAIINGLNKAYKEDESRPFWKVKGMGILFTFFIVIIIIITFFLLVLGELIGKYLFAFLGATDVFLFIWKLIRFVTPFIAMSVVFSMFYKFIPNRSLKLKEVIPGAIFTTVVWTLASWLFSLYVNNFGNYSKVYGSIGGIIVLLIWLYISAMIILIGGEINAILDYFRSNDKEEKYENISFNLPFIDKKM